ncbi:MAG: hypothetical protein P8N15_09035, partial [Flavobacteriaceae bacterium]|nr:hypothetical protein [Flavobacteriaceae bacterium]
GAAEVTICVGADTPAIGIDGAASADGATAGGAAEVTYAWEYNEDGAGWVTIAGENGPTLAAGTVNVVGNVTIFQRTTYATVAGSGKLCEGDPATVRLIIDNRDDPSVLVFEDGVASDFIICEGGVITFQAAGDLDAVEDVTWLLNGSNADALAAGAPAAAANATDQLWLTSSLVSGDEVSYKVTSADGCEFTSEIRTITVNPLPVATLESNAPGDTICAGIDSLNNPISDDVIFTAQPGGTTYEFYINGDLINVADNTLNTLDTSSIANFVFSVIGDDDLMTEVRVIISNANGCTSEASLDVYYNFANSAAAGVNAIELDVTGEYTENICYGTSPNDIVSSVVERLPDGTDDYNTADYANGANVSYQWEKSIDSGANWNSIDGETNRDLFEVPNLTIDTQYRRVTFSELNGKECEDYSNIISFNVSDEIDGGIIERNDLVDGWVDQTELICADEIPNALRVTGATGDDVRYQWEFSIDNISWEEITIANGYDVDAELEDYQPEAITSADLSPIYVLEFVAFDASDNGDTYSVSIGSLDVTATIGEDASAEGGANPLTSIDDVGEILAIRINDSGFGIQASYSNVDDELTLTLNPGSILVPTWIVDDNPGDESDDITSTISYDPNGNIRYYRRSIYPFIGDDPLEDCITYSDVHQVIVNTLTPGKIENDDQYICYDEIPGIFDSFEVAASPIGGVISYQWQSWDGEPDSDYENIDGETNENFIPATNITQTTYYRRIVFSTYTLGGDTVICEVESNEVEIYVIPEVDNGNALGFDGDICRRDADPLQVDRNDTDWFDELTVEDVEAGRGGDDLLEFSWEYSTTNTEDDWNSVVTDFTAAAAAEWDDFTVITSDVQDVVDEHLTNLIDPDITVEIYFRMVTTRYFYDSNGDGIVDNTDEGCSSNSAVAQITILPNITLTQIGGPVDNETVCVNTDITDVVYQWGGGATGVIVDSTPPGINQNIDAVARTITFSGQPTASGIISIRTTPDDGCDIERLTHRIIAVQESITPDYILVQDPDGVADDIPLFSNDGINYNTEFYLCAGQDEGAPDDTMDAQDVTYTACWNSPFAEGLSDDVIWYLEPAEAGDIDPFTGEVDWLDTFRGEATIGVTSLGCGGESGALQITVTVNEFDASASVPTEPIPMEQFQVHTFTLREDPEQEESYSVIINGVEFKYDVQVGDDAGDVISGIADLINNDVSSPINGLFTATDAGRSIQIVADYEGYSAPANPPDGPRGYGSDFEYATNSYAAPENAGPRAYWTSSVTRRSSLEICDELTGAEPLCLTNADTPNTQYFASASGLTDLTFSITDVVPGAGSEASPGIIDADTGVLDWNDDGFFGTFNVSVFATGCDGFDTAVSTHAVEIFNNLDAPEDIFYDALTLPQCPAILGETTEFRSNDQVVWSINNPLAGWIDSVTGILEWNDGFYGTVVVTARTYGCGGLTIQETIVVPGPAVIQRISAANTENQRVCNDSAIDDIRYRLTGASTGANISGLPNGVQTETQTPEQISVIDIDGAVLSDAGDEYQVVIDGITYIAEIGENASGESNGVLVGANPVTTIDDALTILAIRILNASLDIAVDLDLADNSITLTDQVPAGEFTITANADDPGDNDADDITATTTQQGGYFYRIHGTPSVNIAIPTSYEYTITTTGGSCGDETRTGLITVNPLPSVSVDPDSDTSQKLCNNSDGIFTDMIFNFAGTNNYQISWAPRAPTGLIEDLVTFPQTSVVSITGDLISDTQISTVTLGDNSLTDDGDSYTIRINGVNYTATIGEQTDYLDLDFDGNIGGDVGDIIDEVDDVLIVLEDKINNDRDGDGDHDDDDDLIDPADDNLNFNAVATPALNTIDITLLPIADGGARFTISVSSSDPADNDAESITVVTLDSDSYQININGTELFVYIGENATALGGNPNVDTIEEVLQTFILKINDAGLDITATNNLDGESILLKSLEGVPFNITVNSTDLQTAQAETISVNTTQDASKQLTISGNPTDVGLAVETEFEFTLLTLASDFNCNLVAQQDEFPGTITLTPAPTITLISGDEEADICVEESTFRFGPLTGDNIVYEIGGAATGASIDAADLPDGVSSSYNKVSQITAISFSPGDLEADLIDTNVYEIEINGSAEIVTIDIAGAGIDTFDEIFGEFEQNINDNIVDVTASYDAATQVLSLESQAGETMTVNLDNGAGADDPTLISNNTQDAGKFLTISGIPEAGSEGEYVYTITTSGGNCDPITETGTINVLAKPTIILAPIADNNPNPEICNNEPMDPITFDVTAGAGYELNWLGGNDGSAVGIDFRWNVAESTVEIYSDGINADPGVLPNDYRYVLTTNDSDNKCFTAATVTGTIRVILGTESFTFDEGRAGGNFGEWRDSDSDGNDDYVLVEVCENTALDNVIFDVSGGIIGVGRAAGSNDFPDGIEGNYDPVDDTYIIDGIPTEIGTIQVELEATAAAPTCSDAANIIIQIVVHPESTIDLQALSDDDQTICNGELLVDIFYEIGGGGEGAVFVDDTALPAGITGDFIKPNLFRVHGRVEEDENTFTETEIFNYQITTLENSKGCSENVIDGRITVLPKEAIIPADRARLTQLVCEGQAIDEISLTIQGESTWAEYVDSSEVPAGLDFNFVPDADNMGGVVIISGTPEEGSAGSYTFFITTDVDGKTSQCDNVTEEINIEVFGVSTISFTGDNLSALDQSVCEAGTIDDIEFTIGGDATNVTVDFQDDFMTEALNVRVNGDDDPHNVVIHGEVGNLPGDDPITYTYIITTLSPNGCEEASFGGTITVYPPPVIDAAIWDATLEVNNPLCPNDLASIIADDTAISGGVLSQAKVVDITIDNLFSVGDDIIIRVNEGTANEENYSIRVEGWDNDLGEVNNNPAVYDRAQSRDELDDIIQDEINDRPSSFLTAQANPGGVNPGVIRLTARTPGVPFSITVAKSVGASGTITENEIVANQTLNYEYYWRQTNAAGTPLSDLNPNNADTFAVNGLSLVDYSMIEAIEYYKLEVRTGENCSVLSPIVRLERPQEIQLMPSSICSNEIKVNISGGTAPYTIILSNQAEIEIDRFGGVTAGEFPITAGMTDDAIIAGNRYKISALDANGCLWNAGAYITIDTPLELIIDNDTFEVTYDGEETPTCGDSGEISIDSGGFTITGGSAGNTGDYSNLTFSWESSNGDNYNTQNLTNLPPGDYTLTVSDNECLLIETTSQPIRIEESVDFTIAESNDNSTISSCSDGHLEIVVTGGSGDFSYQWTNQFGGDLGDTARIENLNAGRYSVEVTDNDTGCTKRSDEIEITGSTGPLQIKDAVAANQASFDVIDIQCNGEANGQFTVEFTGGTEPYYVSINGGPWLTEGFSSSTISVTTSNASATVVTNTTQVLTVDSLEGGTYSVKIKDSANGPGIPCTDSFGNPIELDLGSVIINEPDLLTIELNAAVTKSIDCSAGIQGSLGVNISGGTVSTTTPYSVLWELYGLSGQVLYKRTTSGSSSDPNGLTITDLEYAGDYTVTVTDAAGCYVSQVVTLDNGGSSDNPFEVGETPTITQPGCNSDELGSIELEMSGGVQQYVIKWYKLSVAQESAISSASSGTGTSSATTSTNTIEFSDGGYVSMNKDGFYLIDQLQPGKYRAIVTDATGCQIFSRSGVIKSSSFNMLNQRVYNREILDCDTGLVEADFSFRLSGTSLAYNIFLDGELVYGGSSSASSSGTVVSPTFASSIIKSGSSFIIRGLSEGRHIVEAQDATNTNCSLD